MKIKSKKIVLACVLALVVCMSLAVGVFAEDPSATAGIQTAVSTALATTQSDVLSTIASVLPYALAIMGAMLVVTLGIKAFKRVSGR